MSFAPTEIDLPIRLLPESPLSDEEVHALLRGQ